MTISNSTTNILYTVIGTLLVFYITTVGTYIYSSSNNIVALQKEVKHLSIQLKKVTDLLETHSNDKWNILLLKKEVQHLSQKIKPFIDYGTRFSRTDFEVEKKIIKTEINNISQQLKKLKINCCVTEKQNVVKEEK